MPSLPQSRVEGYVVVGDFEVIPRRDDRDLPADAVDDQPVADLLAPFVDGLERVLLEVLPDMGVGLVPFPPFGLALFK